MNIDVISVEGGGGIDEGGWIVSEHPYEIISNRQKQPSA
jgi:hypothetical protein